jgi:N-acyl-D-aspartate/D-glutamate deacylase
VFPGAAHAVASTSVECFAAANVLLAAGPRLVLVDRVDNVLARDGLDPAEQVTGVFAVTTVMVGSCSLSTVHVDYQIDAGHLRMGDRADLVIVDPAHLDDSLDSYAEEKVEQYGGLSRMVNRNDDTVSAVLVAGRAVFLNGRSTEVLGEQRTGSFLRANTTTPATTGIAAESVSTAV